MGQDSECSLVRPGLNFHMKLACGTHVAVDSIQYLGVVEMKASAFCVGFLGCFFFFFELLLPVV